MRLDSESLPCLFAVFSMSSPFKWWQGIRRTGQRDPIVPGTSLWLTQQWQSPGNLMKHPPSKLTTGCFLLHLETSREKGAGSLQTCWGMTMWQENGALGGVGVQRLSCAEGRSSQDWSRCWRVGTKPLWRTARVWKGYSSVLTHATETHIYDSGSCAISVVFQSPTALILSDIWSLPNPYCSSSHFSLFMGKWKWRDYARLRHSKCYCRGRDSPKGGMKRSKEKAET